VEVAEKLYVFSPGEELENGCFLGAYANMCLHFVRIFGDIVSGDESRSCGGLQQATKHVDRRRFPGAVRSQEPEHLTLLDLEIKATYRRYIVKLLCQVIDNNDASILRYASVIHVALRFLRPVRGYFALTFGGGTHQCDGKPVASRSLNPARGRRCS
jgi:hypothetical protein